MVGGTGNLEIEGGAGDDTITTLTGDDQIEGGAGDDTIISGLGSDTVTGGTGTDTITIAAGVGEANVVVVDDGDSGITAVTADSVTGFVSGTDTLSLGTAGVTGTNYGEVAGTTFTAALATANGAMSTTGEIYYYVDNSGGANDGGWLFEDSDADGTADQAIFLQGVNIGAFDGTTDIVA